MVAAMFAGGLVVAPSQSVQRTGLDWPSNIGGGSKNESTASYFWLPDNSIDCFPLTAIWRYKVTQQYGYYIPWIIGGVTAFPWNHDIADEQIYVTLDPYPINTSYPNNNTHKWACSVATKDIKVDGEFTLGAAAVVSGDTTVEYDRWYTQAVRITQNGTSLTVKCFYDLPDESKYHLIDVSAISAVYNTPYSPNRITFGDAPWNASQERASGVMRGFQFYQAALTDAEILEEAENDTINAAQTASGIASLVYMNQNPTPSDVTDKSGNGNHPTWFNANRPALWEE